MYLDLLCLILATGAMVTLLWHHDEKRRRKNALKGKDTWKWKCSPSRDTEEHPCAEIIREFERRQQGGAPDPELRAKPRTTENPGDQGMNDYCRRKTGGQGK